MAKNKRTHRNGQRNPTWAEVTRARHRGVDTAEAIFLTVLLDKFGFDADSIQRFYHEAAELSQEIVDGRVNIRDLANVLRDEYQIELDV